MKKRFNYLWFVVLSIFVSVQNSLAAGWDTSAIETAIGDAATNIKAVGLAVLSVLALLFAYRKIVKTTNRS
jgi:hypothetical protein